MFNSKFSFLFLSILISTTLFFSCKKDNAAVDGTNWSVDGFQFNSNNQGGVLIENDTATLFGAGTTSKDAILFLFKEKPSAGVYTVVNVQTKPNIALYDDNECNVIITNKSGDVPAYLSLADDAGVVNVSVSGKKLTATFSNLKLGYLDKNSAEIVNAYASGTVIEK